MTTKKLTESPKIMVYGAYGYTGKLIVELAQNRQIPITLGGRDESKLMALSEQYKYEYRCFGLENKDSINEHIKDMDVVLHCAGPFSETALPMVKACIRKGVHYLDITGEIWVFEDIAKKDSAAKKAGVVLMPGVGFDVVPTDCMTAYLYNKMPDATHLELAFAGSSQLSRGTATTMLKNIDKGGFIRVAGKLKAIDVAAETKIIQFMDKERLCMSIPWGDIATSYFQTGIGNIKVYTGINRKTLKRMKLINRVKGILKIQWIKQFIRNYIKRNIDGPSAARRASGQTQVWGMVRNERGESRSAWLSTPEAYQLTAMTALEAALIVGQGSVYPGYKTPAQAFGADFIKQFTGVKAFVDIENE